MTCGLKGWVGYAPAQSLKVMIACTGETLKQCETGSTMYVTVAQTKATAGTYNIKNIHLIFDDISSSCNRYHYPQNPQNPQNRHASLLVYLQIVMITKRYSDTYHI